MEATKATTVIVNNTSDVLKLKVGGPQNYAEVATIDKQGHHALHVNVNDTYREFLLQGVGGSTDKSVIVTSDDCCDNECITIKEAGLGKFEAQRVARKQSGYGQATAEVITDAGSVVKGKPKFSFWFGWLRQLWAGLWAQKT